ncbi:MAG: hypothetical protein RL272_1319 [Candidatus Parcubacteria bacterium]|jgi:rod shape-determining protein MreC
MASRKTSRAVLAALAAALLLLLSATGALRPVTGPAARLLLAAAAPAYAAGAEMNRAFSRLFAGEHRDLSALTETVERLRIENARLRELAVENDSLKSALAFHERAAGAAVVARVVSETDEDVFHGLLIDRGRADGVRPGQAVVVGDGILIGKVFETRDSTSSVLLLSDTKSRLAVAVQNAADTTGVLEGDRGLSMSIGLIPQSETLSPGDIVVTSGIEPGIRRGLVVGTVGTIAKQTQDPFQSATVIPFSAASHPPFVQVLADAAAAATR